MSDDSSHTTKVPTPVASERTTRVVKPVKLPELIAPASTLEAFHAAMDFGADAVSINLAGFGAAGIGVDLDDLNLAVGHAHNCERKVYVNFGGVLREPDWPDLIECLEYCEEIGVDAIALRDWGLLRVIREHFPRLAWHAHARLNLHNAQGARWAERNGFRRVTLPRELTLEEIREIRKRTEVALEVLVHGRLCHIRAQLHSLAGRKHDADPPGTAMDALLKAGVRNLRIDPQVVSPLYVAATTDLYRRLIDGEGIDDRQVEAHLKYREPHRASRLYFYPAHDDKPVRSAADEEEPPGVYLGSVEEIRGERAYFRAAMDFERHDGVMARARRDDTTPAIQFDTDRINKEGRRVFEVKKGEYISIVVPPEVQVGDELRLVSSHSVRRRYPTGVPRAVQRARMPVHLEVSLKVRPGGERLAELGMPGLIEIIGRVFTIELSRAYPCKLLFADNQPMDENRLRRFFERLGSTRFELKNFSGIIPAGVFVPAAEVNEARRQFFEELDEAVNSRRAETRRAALESVTQATVEKASATPPTQFSALVDRVEFLDALPLDHLHDVALDIAHGTTDEIVGAFDRHGEKLRVAVPANVRKWKLADTQNKLKVLFRKGARRFLVGNIGGFELVAEAAGIARKRRVDTAVIMKRSRDLNPRAGVVAFEPNLPEFAGVGIDLATDWGCCAMTRESVRSWLEQGASRVTFHVADDRKNLRTLLEEFGHVGDVVVYQHTPSFTAETCVNADRLGHCPGKSQCDFTETEVSVEGGGKLSVVDRWCSSVILPDRAFSLSQRVRDLEALGAHRFRLDFVYRDYRPDEIASICERVTNAELVPDTHEGNWA